MRTGGSGRLDRDRVDAESLRPAANSSAHGAIGQESPDCHGNAAPCGRWSIGSSESLPKIKAPLGAVQRQPRGEQDTRTTGRSRSALVRCSSLSRQTSVRPSCHGVGCRSIVKAFETEFNLPRCAMGYPSRYSHILQSPGMPACQSIRATDQFATH
jgi:hypothetical protein